MLLREEMRGYTRGLMREASEKGTPVMRTLFYEFPGDERCWEVEEEYMYGERYLCCPVLEEGQGEMRVYLPKLKMGGMWKNMWGEDVFEGGRDVTVKTPLYEMPVFIRQ
jgi:alpha-D-xyloside xylohydrolase